MSVNMHKKYYEYILSKIRHEKQMEQEKMREKEMSRNMSLPRLINYTEKDEQGNATYDDEHEIFKSLSSYIKSP